MRRVEIGYSSMLCLRQNVAHGRHRHRFGSGSNRRFSVRPWAFGFHVRNRCCLMELWDCQGSWRCRHGIWLFLFLDGGVLLLPESFGGFSNFSRRLRNSRFSFSSLSTLRLSERFSAYKESTVFLNDWSSDKSPASVSDMSLTCCFTDTKIAILSDMCK